MGETLRKTRGGLSGGGRARTKYGTYGYERKGTR